MHLLRHSRFFSLLALLLLPCLLLAACGKPDSAGGSVAASGTSWYTMHIFPDHGGWAITSRGILHTNDNGNTWHVVTPPDLRTRKSFVGLPFSFWNSQVAWFVSQGETHYIQYGQKQVPDLARTFHSIDGGKSWQSGSIPDTASTYSDIRSGAGFLLNSFKQLQPQGENRKVITIHSISSTDPQHAWITVSSVNWHTGGGSESISLVYLRLWQTGDGGQNWQMRWENKDKNYPSYGSFWTYFVTSTTSLMGTTQPTNVLLSHDGGQNWQEKTLPAPKLTAQALQVSSLGHPTFFDATHGVVTIQQYEPNQHSRFFPFVTSDGGQSWQAVASLELPSARSSTQIMYLNRQHWIASGNGMLSRSDDGGAHWQQLKLSANFLTIDSFSFVTNQEGWGISQKPASSTKLPDLSNLVHTTDNGKTWTTVPYRIL